MIECTVYPGESAHLGPLSKLPCSPWIYHVEYQGNSHCATVLHQSLNQLHVVISFVIGQEALHHGDRAFPSHFLLRSGLLGELLALQDLPYLWSHEDFGFDVCFRWLRKEVLKVLKGCRLLTYDYDCLCYTIWCAVVASASWEVHQWLPLDAVPPHSKFGPLWLVPALVVRLSVPAVPKTKVAGKLGRTSLEVHQEWLRGHISDDLQILTKRLDTVVILIEVHHVRQGKKSSCYGASWLWGSWMICQWNGGTCLGYRRFWLPLAEMTTLWQKKGPSWCLKKIKNAWWFFQGPAAYTLFIQQVPWHETSKDQQWTWESDLLIKSLRSFWLG